ncbi:MAG: aminoacyl-tRNA hydrolase [Paracoccaceae bacterium]
MQLFVGLGNPGAKYARNRHNIGFMAVDAIAREHGFPSFRTKFQAELSEGRIGTARVILLKPSTYMNLSGQSVGEAMRFYKLEPGDVTVFHDELDLAPGKCRTKSGGGHAGHNGLRSIHEHIGEAYDRVRLGIGHPGDKALVARYVLHDFALADREWLDPLLEGIASGAGKLASGDAAGFMNAVALKAPPAKKKAPGPTAAPPPSAETAKPRTEKSTGPFAGLSRLLGKGRD